MALSWWLTDTGLWRLRLRGGQAVAVALTQLVRQQELAAIELMQQQHLDALCTLPLQ